MYAAVSPPPPVERGDAVDSATVDVNGAWSAQALNILEIFPAATSGITGEPRLHVRTRALQAVSHVRLKRRVVSPVSP